MTDSPDKLSKEMEEALEGVDLQEIDLPPRRRSGQAGAAGPAGASPDEGRLHKGVVVGVTGDDVIVELGPRMQGVASLSEFSEPPSEGDEFEFSLRGKEDDLWVLSRKDAQVLASWREIEPGKLVKARVTGQNTGGLELRIGPVPAFLPASHVDLKRVEDLSPLIGETMLVEVLEVDRAKKRVTVSRRQVLAREREQAREQTMGSLTSGQVVRGKVTRIESYGAFVEIAPGVEGLLHVSNISRRRVEDPNDVLKVGETLEVMVLEITEGGKRIGLGRKQLEANPWDDLAQRVGVDAVLTGKVVKLTDFGAFVEIEPGVEGLVHVSQLAAGSVRRASDAVSVGQELPVRVLSIEPERERLSLSRLDPHGALLGSEDAADSEAIDAALESGRQQPSLGTNLGDLFKKALG